MSSEMALRRARLNSALKRHLRELLQRANAREIVIPPYFADWANHAADSRNCIGRTSRAASQLSGENLIASHCVYAMLCRSLLCAACKTTTLKEFARVFSTPKVDLRWIAQLSDDLDAHGLESFVRNWVEDSHLQPVSDLLRPAYEWLIPHAVRRARGEVYTPEWLADHVVESVWAENQSWIDPTAGCGSFALALARCARRHRATSIDFLGIEPNPWAALAAAANWALAIAWLSGEPCGQRPIPIVCQDLLHMDRWPMRRATRVVGNPPWILWDDMSAELIEQTAVMWRHYGLFAESGMRSILGGGKKDLAMLITYAAADHCLERGGKLAFVLTASAFKSTVSGRGFRRLRLPDGCPLRILQVDDLTALRPFQRVSSKCATFVLQKGHEPSFPVPYFVWSSTASNPDAQLAEPADLGDPLSPWRHADLRSRRQLDAVLGGSHYQARLGVNSGGANGVYWFERLAVLNNGLWTMRNLSTSGKRALPSHTVDLEPDFLFPILRGNDVRRWFATPSAWILLVQDTSRRIGLDLRTLSEIAPRCLEYLARFEPVLRSRAAFIRYFHRTDSDGRHRPIGPFYTMFNVSRYSHAPVKVVWNRMGHRLAAAVVSGSEGKPIMPQETHCQFALENHDEAYYLAALLNSQWAQQTLESFGAAGKSFATPGTIHRLRLDAFDPTNRVHRELTDVGRLASDEANVGTVTHETTNRVNRCAARYWGIDDPPHELLRSVADRSLAGKECRE